MGMALLKNYVVAILVKGDNHKCFIRVSDYSIRVSRSLLLVGKPWALIYQPNNTHVSFKIKLHMCSTNNGQN